MGSVTSTAGARRRLRPAGLGALCVIGALGAFGLAGCGREAVTGTSAGEKIVVGPRATQVIAGEGSDTVVGGRGPDDLNGNPGEDVVHGRGGADTLHGGRGADTLNGGKGDDLLFGDRGNDVLYGAQGRDRFVLTPQGGDDLLADFNGAEGDRIRVEGFQAATAQPQGNDIVVQLGDGSRMLVAGAAGSWRDNWLVLQYPRKPLSRLVQDRSTLGALIVAVIALCALAAAILHRLFKVLRGRSAARPQPALAAAAPDADGAEPGQDHGGLAERLPHATQRSVGLDLVRAIAILTVMVSHWAPTILPWFGGQASERIWFLGEFGVDLFFALSGFLIGQILFKQASLEPSFRNYRIFMTRRWLRTLPLYFAVLVFLLIVEPPPDRLVYALRYGTLTQNVFGAAPTPGFFLISWSLTVEEWFYLLFGAATFAAFWLLRRPLAMWLVLAIFIVVPVALLLWVPYTPEGIYRLDQIAFGAAAAQLYAARAAVFRRPLACLVVGCSILAAVWFWFPPIQSPYLMAAFLTSISVGCCLVLPAAARLPWRHGRAARLVEAVSAMAYPLYLFHGELLSSVDGVLRKHYQAPAWLCAAVAIAAPFALAYLSFRFFESPILRLRPEHPDKAVPRALQGEVGPTAGSQK